MATPLIDSIITIMQSNLPIKYTIPRSDVIKVLRTVILKPLNQFLKPHEIDFIRVNCANLPPTISYENNDDIPHVDEDTIYDEFHKATKALDPFHVPNDGRFYDCFTDPISEILYAQWDALYNELHNMPQYYNVTWFHADTPKLNHFQVLKSLQSDPNFRLRSCQGLAYGHYKIDADILALSADLAWIQVLNHCPSLVAGL